MDATARKEDNVIAGESTICVRRFRVLAKEFGWRTGGGTGAFICERRVRSAHANGSMRKGDERWEHVAK